MERPMPLPFSDPTLITLIRFFEDSFAEDAAGVGDWFARSNRDIDRFVDNVEAIKRSIKSHT